MKIVPYLYFNGNCEEALNFYHTVLGGQKSDILRYGSQGPDVPDETAMRVMHAELAINNDLLYFSDTSPDDEFKLGMNVQINLNLDSQAEINQIFKGLSEGANITMPLQETFWDAIYGALVDKFGISWSFNYQKNQ